MALREVAHLTNQARMVTWRELYNSLHPYVAGWSWGEDALWDLWIKGAPAPQDRCPPKIYGGKPCPEYPKCSHIRRILLPNYFAKWWKEVSDRMGYEIVTATKIKE